MSSIASIIFCYLYHLLYIVGAKDDVVTFALVPHETVVKRRRRRRLVKSSAKIVRPNTHRRNLSLLPSNQHITTLYQGYGTHYIDLWVGTPTPQRQTVIVDTGSHLTAFPCSECKDCGESYHSDAKYDEGSSVSFQKLSCKDCSLGRCLEDECYLGLSYKEGSSWTAFEARDILFAGGAEKNEKVARQASEMSFEMQFGCQTALTGLFKTQLEDGILGMSDENGSFWRQMYDAHKISKKQFSLCFSHQPIVQKDTLAGAITLGGRDENLSSMPLVYAKKYKMYGFYTVRLRNILFWNKGQNGVIPPNQLLKQDVRALNITETVLNSGGVMIDSGTTDTYLNLDIRDQFYNVWLELTGTDYHNHEVKLTQEEFNSLPTILFQIQGDDSANHALADDPNTIPGLVGDMDKSHPYDILVAMPPSNFMEYDPKRKMYQARILVNEPGTSVLGANFMMGHDVLFDIDNNRLGFTESDCDSSYLFTS